MQDSEKEFEVSWRPQPGPQTAFVHCTFADEIFFGGARGGGKSLHVDEPVLTPFGWKRIGDVKVGDRLCATDGTHTDVIGVYPQGERELFNVILSDGAVVRADAEHNWLAWRTNKSVKIDNERVSGEASARVAKTWQIREWLEKGRVAIPVCEPVAFNVSRGQKLDPYVVGVLIGDGSLTNRRMGIRLQTADKEIADEFLKSFPSAKRYHDDRGNKSWEMRAMKGTDSAWSHLERIGLAGCNASSKFIPRCYLMADKDKRWALLQGLMDTDGWAEEGRAVFFCSTSERLARDVMELSFSLGAVCTLQKKKNEWTVRIKLKRSEMAFRLERKRAVAMTIEPQIMQRYIERIEPCGKGDAVCIQVSHPNSLFITKDYIVTHNTDAALGKLLIKALQFGKGMRGIFFRRTYKQLEEVALRAKELYTQHGAKWKESNMTFTFPNGAWIKLGYLDRDADADNYQGKSFCVGVNTEVLMPDGRYKKISDITPGMEVMTLEGPRCVKRVTPPYKAPCVLARVYSEKHGAYLGEQLQPWTHPILTSVAEIGTDSSLKQRNASLRIPDQAPWKSLLPHPYLHQERRACGVFSGDDRSDCKGSEDGTPNNVQPLLYSGQVVLFSPLTQLELSSRAPTQFRTSCKYDGPLLEKRHQCPKSSRDEPLQPFSQLLRETSHRFSTFFSQIETRVACGLLGLQKALNSTAYYLACLNLYDVLLPHQTGCGPVSSPSQDDAEGPFLAYRISDEMDSIPLCTSLQSAGYIHPYTGELRQSLVQTELGHVTISDAGEALVTDLSVDVANHYITKCGIINCNTDIVIEEAGTFPNFAPIAKLKACLRSAKGIPTQMLLTGNPGGPGANWVRARYIDPAPAGWHTIKELSYRVMPDGQRIPYESSRIYIPSRVTDNQILMQNDPNYIARLMDSGSEQLVKAWLDGDFYVIDGAFFDNFDMRKHVMKATELPQWWTRYRAMDWGSAKPFCVQWIAVASEHWFHPVSGHFVPKGALVVYNEWYGVKIKSDGTVQANVGLKLFAEQVGKGILERETAMRQEVSFGVADPSAFKVDGGPSIIERIFRSTAGKVRFRPGDNARVGTSGAMGGWDQVRGRLGGEDFIEMGRESVPMLFFFDNCQHTLRTLPMMQHDPDRPEDMDTSGEDHAADTTRYACMARPYTKPTPVAANAKLSTLSDVTLNQLWYDQANNAPDARRL